MLPEGAGEMGMGGGNAPCGVGLRASVVHKHKGLLGILGSLAEAMPALPCHILGVGWGSLSAHWVGDSVN